MTLPARRAAAAAAGAILLAAGALLLHACDRDTTQEDLRDIEKAYYALRDAILQGDDEAFFRMHCREAREGAVVNFPAVRAEFLSSSPGRRQAFCEQFHVSEDEFRNGDPRSLVVRMMPWRSGWRDRREAFRSAKVRDVRIDRVPLPGGGVERRGVVVLAADAAGPGEGEVNVVFVRDEDGWRRKWFFTEIPPPPAGGAGKR